MNRSYYGRASGGRKVPGKMNVLETSYSKHLEARRAAGEILEWAYEPEKLKLRETSYCPDFRVILPDGIIEWHECKAHHRFYEKGLLKIKLAAEMHPYVFKMVERKDKKWVITEV